MSSLKLNKFLPTRKAWRVFTRKLQTKFPRFHHSKTIRTTSKRQCTLVRKTSTKGSFWPAFCIHRKLFKPKKTTRTRHYHSYCFQQRPSAVYIDQLFIEPAVSTVQEYLPPDLEAAASKLLYKEEEEICQSSSVSVDRRDNSGNALFKGKGKLDEPTTNSADDMWESLVLESPQQMKGINERAEEFINKFRADMMLQERRLARHL
ncbi:OLC1v1007042C1 [Oldenlandia corymbosa var. corymbosa]|uniref:OLC1v1007042C1 n=1 Tax=Oldenlandia corymbosa var. corymbosa TaxID=529605 RepID=A0AAV1DIE4_OLDCO|nr:OLC1v1007042C1 [Oldenlandia corymbosa var. corymbosa]